MKTLFRFLLVGLVTGCWGTAGAAFAAARPGLGETAALSAILAQAPGLPDPRDFGAIGWVVVIMAFLIGLAGMIPAAIDGWFVMLSRGRREAQKIEQPIETQRRHPHVQEPEFKEFKRDIWDVVKGLRAAMSKIEQDVASMRETREANRELLSELNEETIEIGKQVAALSALLKQHLKEHHE